MWCASKLSKESVAMTEIEPPEVKPTVKKSNTLLINLANLFKVKTIITLVMVIGATIFVAQGVNMPDWFVALVTSIVTFYFTKNNEATS